jgi:hypothetical protein
VEKSKRNECDRSIERQELVANPMIALNLGIEVKDWARPFEAIGRTARENGRRKDWAIKGRAERWREFIEN